MQRSEKISEVPIVMITSVDSELDQLISLKLWCR